MKKTSDYVFVYGTLKKGFGNSFLLKDSCFISEAETVNKYALYERGIPFVIKHQNDTKIKGEVYKVDSYTLYQLDILEGHPNAYKRELVEIKIQDYHIKAWLYFYPNPIGNKVKDGVYKRY
jgi:gamma-glutamylaminecyclotransferase|tara:strand:+ start:4634 stop:4996 length:363 start_codon:yes stop_codon:yes gene_type:complete